MAKEDQPKDYTRFDLTPITSPATRDSQELINKLVEAYEAVISTPNPTSEQLERLKMAEEAWQGPKIPPSPKSEPEKPKEAKPKSQELERQAQLLVSDIAFHVVMLTSYFAPPLAEMPSISVRNEFVIPDEASLPKMYYQADENSAGVRIYTKQYWINVNRSIEQNNQSMTLHYGELSDDLKEAARTMHLELLYEEPTKGKKGRWKYDPLYNPNLVSLWNENPEETIETMRRANSGLEYFIYFQSQHHTAFIQHGLRKVSANE